MPSGTAMERSSSDQSTSFPKPRSGSVKSVLSVLNRRGSSGSQSRRGSTSSQDSGAQPPTRKGSSSFWGRRTSSSQKVTSAPKPLPFDEVHFSQSREGGAQMWVGYFPLQPGSDYICGSVRSDNFDDLDKMSKSQAMLQQEAWEKTLAQERVENIQGLSARAISLKEEMDSEEAWRSDEEDVRKYAWIESHEIASRAAETFNSRSGGQLRVTVMPPAWAVSCYRSHRAVRAEMAHSIDLGQNPETRQQDIRNELLRKHLS